MTGPTEQDWLVWNPYVNPELVTLHSDVIEYLKVLDSEHGGPAKVVNVSYSLEVVGGMKGQKQEVLATNCITVGISDLLEVPSEFVTAKHGFNLVFATKRDFHDSGAGTIGFIGNWLYFID